MGDELPSTIPNGSSFIPLPRVLQGNFKVVNNPVNPTAAGNANEIAKLFPCLWGQQSSRVLASKEAVKSDRMLNIGVVCPGDQEIGTHNIIRGITDYIQTPRRANAGITIYVFEDGLDGIWSCNCFKLRNFNGLFELKPIVGCSDTNYIRRVKIETPKEFQAAEDAVAKLELDALVVIGGDEANTTACLLAENFRSKKVKTRVIGCPNKCDLKVKTIDGDLDCKQVIGFDAMCKIYAEMIGNLMTDARSAGEYYHFVRVTGCAVSHLTLECALQTHPNISLIREEVIAKKLTLKNTRDHIVDVICKRSELSYNYGVILIPEGPFDIFSDVQKLIAELNKMWRREVSSMWYGRWRESDEWKKKLSKQSEELFGLLPREIQEQVMSLSDPFKRYDSIVKIETDMLLIQMVGTELEKWKNKGLYKGDFKAQPHVLGSSLATDFNFYYCYAMGNAAVALVENSDETGLITSLGNLGAPVEEWTVGGIPLTCLMEVERRHDDDADDDGTLRPVIKMQAVVELDGAPFNTFASMRDEWALVK